MLTSLATVWLVTAARLGIDFGTTHTVAALAGTGSGAETGAATGIERPQPLLFDASFLLPSSVYAETDGRLLVGQDAIRSARLDPTRFEPNPKRRVDEGRLLLGEREYRVTDAIGAVLRRVADEAARVAGSLPAATVLTHPAGWAETRRAVLATAASEAGLPSVTLMPEPVAAATYFTAVLGHRVEPGGTLVVYDFGGGTFDTSVLRREPDGGWTTLAADGLPDLGGIDLDEAIVAHLASTVGEPALWRRLTHPESEVDRRRQRMLWDDVRLAKEQLSRSSSAALHVPLFDVDVHLTREEFERIARPYLERTVDLTAGLLQRAGIRADRLAGVFPVGGSSRIPLAGTLLHHRLGIAPTPIEQPELVVALGSLSQRPATARVFSPPRPSMPIWPTGAVPVSGVPVSPASVSGSPISAPPVASPTSPGYPGYPGYPGAETVRPATRRRSLSVIGAVAILVLAILGANRAYTFFNSGDSGAPSSPTTNAAKPGAPKQTVPMNKTAWFAGWELAFGTASYDKTRNPTLSIAVTAKNLNPEDNRLDLEPTFAGNGKFTSGSVAEAPTVPGLQASHATFEFDVAELAGSLSDATLTFGEATVNQTVVPLGPKAATAHRPFQVLGGRALTLRDLQFTIKHCDVTGDVVTAHKQAPANQLVLSCWMDAVYRGPAMLHYLDEGHLRLVLPDGTAAGPVEHPNQNLYPNVVSTDRFYAFYVKDPPAGKYTLQFVDRHTSETLGPNNVVNVPLSVPSSPAAPSGN